MHDAGDEHDATVNVREMLEDHFRSAAVEAGVRIARRLDAALSGGSDCGLLSAIVGGWDG